MHHLSFSFVFHLRSQYILWILYNIYLYTHKCICIAFVQIDGSVMILLVRYCKYIYIYIYTYIKICICIYHVCV